MISIAYVPNPFTYEGRIELRVEWEPGATVDDYFETHLSRAALRSPTLVCRRTGGLVDQEQWGTTRPLDCEDLVFLEKPEGIGLGVALAANWLASVATTAVGGFLLKTAVFAGVSYALNRALAPEQDEDLLEGEPSPTYNFRGLQTTARQGAPIPIIYGKHRTGGNIIELETTSAQVGSTLSPYPYGGTIVAPEDINFSQLIMTIELSEGEVASIGDFRINGNSITNYNSISSGSFVLPEDREGTPNQEPTTLGNADQTRTTFTVEADLRNDTSTPGGVPGSWINYTTTQSIDAVFLGIDFPNGLFFRNTSTGGSEPSFIPTWVWFDVRHKPAGSSDSNYSSWTQFQVNRAWPQPFLLSCWYPFPSYGQWDIQVRRYTEVHPTLQQFITNDIRLDSVTEVLYDAFSHPNTALVQLSIYAGEDLVGSIPQVTSEVIGRKVDRWNPVAEQWEPDAVDPDNPTDGDYSNPAWIAIDILTNPRYGMGAIFDRDVNFDLDNWYEFAEWCNELVSDGEGGFEKRCEFNGIFDGKESLGQALTRVLAVARATPVILGDTIRVKWERPRAISRIFNMATITEGSWQSTYQSRKRRPTRVDVSFLNKDRAYTVDSAPGTDEEAIAEGLPLRSTTLEGFGITKESQARRHAKFHMNTIRYINRGVTFETDALALDLEIGDLIGVAHETPEWGIGSGRIQSATSTTVTIDEDLELAAGVTYSILVQHITSDTIERRQLSMAAGTYAAGSTLTVDSAFDATPAANTPYSIGRLQREVAPFVVTNIDTRPDFTRKITAVNYDERIHEDDPDPLETIVYSELPDPLAIPPCIAASPLLEPRWINGQPAIRVAWNPTAGVTRFRVYYRDTAAPSALWNLGADVIGAAATIEGLERDKTYVVTVQQVSQSGAFARPGGCPTATITLTGVDQVLDAPASLTVTTLGDQIDLDWPAVPGADYYEVRRGQHWLMSRFMGSTPGTQLTSSRFAPSQAGPDVERFWVRAVSQAGVYGLPVSTDFDVPYWYGSVTPELEHDAAAGGWTGTKTNCTVSSGSLVLTSAASDAVYTTGALDTGAIVNYRLGAIVWASLNDSPARSTLTFTTSSTTALTQSAHGPVNPADWYTNVTIEYRAAATSGGLSSESFTNLVTQVVPSAKPWIEVRVTFNTTDSDWIPQLDELLVTAEEIP